MKSLKQNAGASFLIVLLVYVLATAVGILIYHLLPLPWWLSLLLADTGATIVTFIFSLLFQNASVYDPYWSVQPPVILISFAIGKNLTALGICLILVVTFWAVRLTANWAYNFGNLTHQDWRYTQLHEQNGAFYPVVSFVGIHMIPTLVVYGCTLPAVYAILNHTQINVGSILFLCVSVGATVLQGISDIQMHKFRKHRTGPFIRSGLWKYSRHPNYLGEILMWWGVALAVICAAPQVWYLATGAVANTLLFLFISIPMADKRQAKKEGFAEYKKQTRILLPIKKRA